MAALWDNGAITLAGMLRSREVSAREVIAAHIERIETADWAVNAVVTRCFERAMGKAADADQALARGGPPGLLHGLPVAHKDLVDTAGVRTTYGSPLFAEHVPDHDDLVVSRMAAAGAISLGKTNTPEFGAGSHTVNRVFGATRNPYDLSRSAGGSSGGAAAALAARMVCLADGSDLGGSLRNPASFCNVVGPAAVAGPGAEVAGHRPGRHAGRGRADGPHRGGRRPAAGGPVRARPAGCRSPWTRRRPRWPPRPTCSGPARRTCAGSGWRGARTWACRSSPRSGPRWRRPGPCWRISAAR